MTSEPIPGDAEHSVLAALPVDHEVDGLLGRPSDDLLEADYPRFTDVQVFLPRVESITLHDVPAEEHQTEVVIHDELGATVSIRLISDRRIRLIDLRRR